MFFRGRRLRSSEAIRSLIRENHIRAKDLVMGYFVVESDDPSFARPITSMPGQCQFSIPALIKKVGEDISNGLTACLLFGIPSQKDTVGSKAYDDNGIIQRAIKELKSAYPELIIIADTCLCEYTTHGHCGLLSSTGEVMNDPTLSVLAKIAVSQAKAGADIIAPSDMMDGRVLAIRKALDEHGFINTPIMSYAVKYAGSFYGPFREAAESAPVFGDRKSYQMDPPNSREAMREAQADINEGADILIVKPAGPYLDIIRQVRDRFDIPIAAYQVSGEYSLIKAAAMNGWINEDGVILESLLGIKRAGADIIITYFASELLHKGIVV